MGQNRKYTKNGDNNVGKYCDKLVEDFFYFCDGHPEKIKTMVWMDDIKAPMPPSPKQMGTLLSRMKVIWDSYCKNARLPMETQHLLINKVKKQWEEKGKQQKKSGVPKRKRSHPSA